MPVINVRVKLIKYDSAERISGKISGTVNEYIDELKRDFGRSLFLKFFLDPITGAVSNKTLIPAPLKKVDQIPRENVSKEIIKSEEA